MLTEIQAGHFWVDDLGDDMEYVIVIPPRPWTNGSAHSVIWSTPHSLDHCYKENFFAFQMVVGNYAFPPQAIHRWF